MELWYMNLEFRSDERATLLAKANEARGGRTSIEQNREKRRQNRETSYVTFQMGRKESYLSGVEIGLVRLGFIKLNQQNFVIGPQKVSFSGRKQTQGAFTIQD
ncbi:hypothetical protein AAHA92_20824 [Salvia divinorum]|uniref:Uncharacterized protein n=1 Tax=Salvia divinorum TaxID=28513 RepID=A0ABD1GL70_SALDI